MKNLKLSSIQKAPFLLAALTFLADLVFGVPAPVKKIIFLVLLVAMLAVAGASLYKATRPGKYSK